MYKKNYKFLLKKHKKLKDIKIKRYLDIFFVFLFLFLNYKIISSSSIFFYSTFLISFEIKHRNGKREFSI